MANRAATIVLEGYLAGVFDVLNAMLPDSLTYRVGQPREMDEDELNQALKRFPTALQGTIQNNLGAVALLLTADNAAHLAALIGDATYVPGREMDESERETLRETAESALGSGVTNLMQRFGRAVEQLESVSLTTAGPTALAEIEARLEHDAVMCDFNFSGGAIADGSGVAICDRRLINLVPPTLAAEEPEKGSKPVLSQNEVKDILGGLNVAQSSQEDQPYAANLERVLDIRLVAQARLGRVDMPINQLLTLGPGSVVDVGHLVDEPIELLVNDKLIAKGDVVVVDEKFGLRITEIVSPKERIESLR